MSELIYVVGHKNPDTDSICAAVAFARLKERMGMKNVLPARAGKINRETEFVLNHFGVKAPDYLADLHPRVKDLLNGGVPTIYPEASLQEAWHLMKKTEQKTLPVVDHHQRMAGMLTVGDVSEAYVEIGQQEFGSLHISVKNVLKTLGGRLLAGQEEREFSGRVRIGAMHPDTMEEVLGEGDILILGNRQDAQERALGVKLSAMILTGDAQLSPALLDLAREKGMTVLSVPHDTFTTVRLLPMCIPVASIMKKNVIAFQEDDLLSEVQVKMLETRYRNYPVLNERDQVVGLISRYHLLSMKRKKIILVDHNEWSQAVAGADQAQVLEVIDHHRAGGIQTGDPIMVRMEPVGSTCTLVAQSYLDHGLEPEGEMAGLMLAAILSDTMLFKSPTCTVKDREMAKYLAEKAGVDVQDFGVKMLKASSNILDRPLRELIEEDLKEFSTGAPKIAVGQISVMGAETAAPVLPALKEELEAVRREKGVDYLLLMVTDLLEENTELLISGERPGEVGKAFDLPVTDRAIFLSGVLSRKKQVVPFLSRYFF